MAPFLTKREEMVPRLLMWLCSVSEAFGEVAIGLDAAVA